MRTTIKVLVVTFPFIFALPVLAEEMPAGEWLCKNIDGSRAQETVRFVGDNAIHTWQNGMRTITKNIVIDGGLAIWIEEHNKDDYEFNSADSTLRVGTTRGLDHWVEKYSCTRNQ